MTVLAALFLLSMPVNYRGGAELEHAHGLFQFWFPGGHATAEHQNHHLGSRQSDRANTDSKLDPSPDTPTVSEMGSPAENASGIALMLPAGMLSMISIKRMSLPANAHPQLGHVVDPEIPPPRILPSSSI